VQILIALIVGAAIGTAAHFHLSGRDTRGIALAPILGTLAAGAVWTILTWAGVGTDSFWLWVSPFIAAPLVTYPTIALLTRMRHAKDAARRVELGIA
jgi:uncharacterized membrane protein YeaQ/YmgE (transglycosylase-associated protein family)